MLGLSVPSLALLESSVVLRDQLTPSEETSTPIRPCVPSLRLNSTNEYTNT